MSQDNIKSFERESFKAKLSKLAEGKTVDDAVFADVVYTAVSKFGLEEEKFRDAFGLTKGAVERWSQLKNMPQPQIRPKIMGWIRENLS
ncbi:MAG: hypothetical protein K8R48_10100 [Alphaproteobacteria bacterium]|nr:hypothetical protein [Alphaproteobacteria bacterium]